MDELKAEVTQEIKNNQPKAEEKPPEAPAEVKEEAPKSAQDWNRFREARAIDRKRAEESAAKAAEREAEVSALRAALEASLNKPQPQNQYQPSYDQQEETQEQLIARHVAQALKTKEAEEEKRRHERETQEYPQRLRQTFPDFQNTIADENLDYLEFHHPELAKSLSRQPQSFEKWADIYNAVKRYVPMNVSKKEIAKADKNLLKPQSMSAASMSTGGTAVPSHKLDEARKMANWERMQREMKSLRQ